MDLVQDRLNLVASNALAKVAKSNLPPNLSGFFMDILNRKGYRLSFRDKWKLFEFLSHEEFDLLELYIDITDYGKKYFGTFLPNKKEIAVIFKCTDRSIRKWHAKLIETGMVIPLDNGRFAVNEIERNISHQTETRNVGSGVRNVGSGVRNAGSASSSCRDFNNAFNKRVNYCEGLPAEDRKWMDSNIG